MSNTVPDASAAAEPPTPLPLPYSGPLGGNFPEADQQIQVELEQAEADAAFRIVKALETLGNDQELKAEPSADGRVAFVTLVLLQPGGERATRVQALLTGAAFADAAVVDGEPPLERPYEPRAALPLADGSVTLHLPPAWARRKLVALEVTISGSNGSVPVRLPVAGTMGDAEVLPVTLPRRIDPAPLAALGDLAAVIAGAPGDGSAPAGPTPHLKPTIALGQDECDLVFRTDPSQDRYPYGILFRLTDPALSLPTLARTAGRAGRDGAKQGGAVLHAVYPDTLAGLDQRSLHAADRVMIERPIGVDAFGRTLSGAEQPRRLPMAATLAIGYVVTLAQRWTQRGLALGDLVYSLPLAPGEQQRIAVVERRQTESVLEREALEQREDIRFDETDTSSVQATFAAGFSEAAQGGSSYAANSSSFSIAAAAGGAMVGPFGAAAAGVATSYGTASSSGSTSTWMSGARQSTSEAAQNTHAAVSRRAQAVRSSSRTGVRLATAIETTQVTTKVITNHNHVHALTMQYWEVLRVFDVTTVVEDVALVCMVPLDIIDFLPSGQRATLADAPLSRAESRAEVLARYELLLRHHDVLLRAVPWRLRRGLQALADLAADPRMTVQSPTGPALVQVTVTVRAAVCAQDTLSAQLLLRNSGRTGPVPLTGEMPPLPQDAHALADDAQVFAKLRRQRDAAETPSFTGTVSLPPSVALSDIAGLVIGAGLRRLDYTFAPEAVKDGPNLGLRSQTFSPDQLGRELGPLLLTSLTAVSGTTPLADLALSGMPVPPGGAIVPVLRQAPELSYDSLLEIERTLQWVLRNTMACSLQVIAAMHPEARAVMLERYTVTPPTLEPDGRVREGVPLLSCISNSILGFHGNCAVMPFRIPLEFKDRYGVDSAQIQRALKRFHTEGFDQPVDTVVLPTRGVLGEAVLGRCASAEKIDLTRFWNWKDSPGDEATAIGTVSLPSSNLLQGAEAPSKLTGLSPIINNFSTSGPTADSSLAQAIGQRALDLSKPFDVAALTNAGNLKDVVTKTADVAESARKDALGAAKEVAMEAMKAAANRSKGDSNTKADSDHIFQSIDSAQQAGHITGEQAGALKQQALKQMIGSGSQPLPTDLSAIEQARSKGLISDEQAGALTSSALSRLTGGSPSEVTESQLGLPDAVRSAVGAGESSVSYTRGGDGETLSIEKKEGVPKGALGQTLYNVGVDTNVVTTSVAACLAGQTLSFTHWDGNTYSGQIKFVCRYLAPHLDPLTVAECKELAKYGLQVVSIFELNNDPSHMSYANGTADADRAFDEAHKLGQPADTPVYFTADFPAGGHLSAIQAYFQGVADRTKQRAKDGKPVFMIGAYASRLALAHLYSLGLTTTGWLVTAYWQVGSPAIDIGNDELFRQGNIWQKVTMPNPKVCGINVDYNVSMLGTEGSWSP